MIKTPQVFIIYEPGMFGTLLCNLFLCCPIFKNTTLKKFDSDINGFNAHYSSYTDMIKNFHTHEHFLELSSKDETQLKNFFMSAKIKNMGVHRLSSYFFLNLDYGKYFKNYVRILLVPQKHRIENYVKRYYFTTNKTYESEYYLKNLKKKNLKNIPEFFLQNMSIKEKNKYILSHMDTLNAYKINKKHDIFFDPDDISDKAKIQKIIDDTCDLLNLNRFILPAKIIKNIENFLEINKQFLIKPVV